MNSRKGMTKRLLFVISFAIILLVSLLNIKHIFAFIGNVITILKPLIVAFIMAFVLNIFMKMFEYIIYKIFPNKKVKNKKTKEVEEKRNPLKEKLIRGTSIILTLILIFFLVKGLIQFIIPELYESVESIIKSIPTYFNELRGKLNEIQAENVQVQNAINSVNSYIDQNSAKWLKELSNLLPQAFEITKNVTSGIFDTILSLILAIYFLFSKEYLIKNSKRVVYALSSKKTAEYISKIAYVANLRFQAFVRGQLIEAIVIGALCYVGMLIFKMPYALLISVLVSVTALIPIFGAWIGGAIGALLLIAAAPHKVILFIIFLVVLQQLEGNLIYPKVVGNQVGISGLWVLIALVIGNAVAGVPGILIGIPLFATVYTLFGEYITKKLENKKIEI